MLRGTITRLRRRFRDDDRGISLSELLVGMGLTTIVALIAVSALIVVQNRVISATNATVAQSEGRSLIDTVTRRLRGAMPPYRCADPVDAETPAECNKVELAENVFVTAGTITGVTDRYFCFLSSPISDSEDLVAPMRTCLTTDPTLQATPGRVALVIREWDATDPGDFIGIPTFGATPTRSHRLGEIQGEMGFLQYYDGAGLQIPLGTAGGDGARPIDAASQPRVSTIRFLAEIRYAGIGKTNTETLDLLASIRSARFSREQNWIDDRLP